MLTRNLDKAREAYKKKDAAASRAAHDAGLHNHEHHLTQGKYIKSAIYGGLDGIITTFAVVAGVAGANLQAGIVLILGFANLIADGISMAVGDYLSTKAEQEYHRKEREREEWEFDNYAAGEKKEMVEIYMEKGIGKADAEKAVDILSKKRNAFVDIMMVWELGILEENESPMKNAIVTFCSFAICGFVPLLAYVLATSTSFFGAHTFLIAIILTGLTLFTLGALKTYITEKNWLYSGTEMLLVGGIAASAAYLIGFLLSGLA